MSSRLLPWAACAALVLALAVHAALSGKGPVPPASGAVRGMGETGREIRLGPAEVWEFHDDGSRNRLTAESAVYEYERKTLAGRGVIVYPMAAAGAARDSIVRAPEAHWDFDRAAISLPEGARVDHAGGWTGEVSPATLDLAVRTLRAPGAATFSGPGFSVAGDHFAWDWGNGRITMDSPKGRIVPSAVPRRRG